MTKKKAKLQSLQLFQDQIIRYVKKKPNVHAFECYLTNNCIYCNQANYAPNHKNYTHVPIKCNQCPATLYSFYDVVYSYCLKSKLNIRCLKYCDPKCSKCVATKKSRNYITCKIDVIRKQQLLTLLECKQIILNKWKEHQMEFETNVNHNSRCNTFCYYCKFKKDKNISYLSLNFAFDKSLFCHGCLGRIYEYNAIEYNAIKDCKLMQVCFAFAKQDCDNCTDLFISRNGVFVEMKNHDIIISNRKDNELKEKQSSEKRNVANAVKNLNYVLLTHRENFQENISHHTNCILPYCFYCSKDYIVQSCDVFTHSVFFCDGCLGEVYIFSMFDNFTGIERSYFASCSYKCEQCLTRKQKRNGSSKDFSIVDVCRLLSARQQIMIQQACARDIQYKLLLLFEHTR